MKRRLISVLNRTIVVTGRTRIVRFCWKKMGLAWSSVVRVLALMCNNNPMLYLFGKVWQFSKGNRLALTTVWLMFVVAKVCDLLIVPLISAKVIDLTQADGLTKFTVVSITVLLVVRIIWTCVYWLLHGPARVMECNNAFQVRSNYRAYLLKGVLGMPLEWHSHNHSGGVKDKMEKGVDALFWFAENSYEVVYAIVGLLGTYGILAYRFGWASIWVLAMFVITAWIIFRFDRVLVKQYDDLNSAENEVAANIQDRITKITTIIIMRLEARVLQAIMHKMQEPYKLFKRNNAVNEFKWFLVSICCNVTTLVVTLTYILDCYIHSKRFSGGSTYLLIAYLQQVAGLFDTVANMYSTIVQKRTRVANAETLSVEFRQDNLTNHVLPVGWKQIEVRNMFFSYRKQADTRPRLNDVSFCLERGLHYALVGKSGSGKSTLVMAMAGALSPQSYALRVDGRVVEEGFPGIVRGMGVAPQKPDIYATTILDNITMEVEYDIALVEYYARMACFDEIVAKLPQGYQTVISEQGNPLSGGQMQRMALVRTLLACHDRDMLVMDEPTSSLDGETEMMFYRNIIKGFRDRTVVSSVHGLRVLPLFDKIIMFEQGKLVACGSLQELVADCPPFQKLWAQYA